MLSNSLNQSSEKADNTSHGLAANLSHGMIIIDTVERNVIDLDRCKDEELLSIQTDEEITRRVEDFLTKIKPNISLKWCVKTIYGK